MRVLVATDFSSHAEDALALVAGLAMPEGGLVLDMAELGMHMERASKIDQLGLVRLCQALDLVSQPRVQHRVIVALRISPRPTRPVDTPRGRRRA